MADHWSIRETNRSTIWCTVLDLMHFLRASAKKNLHFESYLDFTDDSPNAICIFCKTSVHLRYFSVFGAFFIMWSIADGKQQTKNYAIFLYRKYALLYYLRCNNYNRKRMARRVTLHIFATPRGKFWEFTAKIIKNIFKELENCWLFYNLHWMCSTLKHAFWDVLDLCVSKAIYLDSLILTCETVTRKNISRCG